MDRLGVYKMRRDHAEMALSANLHAQQAEDELNKRKESVPLNVMIGSQINHKNVAELMRTWDRRRTPHAHLVETIPLLQDYNHISTTHTRNVHASFTPPAPPPPTLPTPLITRLCRYAYHANSSFHTSFG